MRLWRSWALALGVGAAGGVLFNALHLPLPWMLGSMTACTVAALSGVPVAVPRHLRSVMMGVLGLMLGSAFTPDIPDRISGWGPSLGAQTLAMVVATAGVMAYLRKVGGFGRVTAYFSAAPGGINEMVVTGGAMGGDEHAIALIHALRILLIVFAVPFGFRLVTGVQSQPMARAMGTLADLSLVDAGMLVACAAAGAGVARVLRFPAWMLTGPMLASAAVHLGGVTVAHPPSELVIAAQVVVGSGLGARFSTQRWSALAGMVRVALGSTAIMLAASAGAAGLTAALSGEPFALLLLSFVPGGIAEMCLIALALGQDVAFVSTHHVVRVVMVIMAAPLIFRLARRLEEKKA
ncbi:MAG: AbrB family transcriptional regulator [Solirubrobacterales bacterium]